MKILLIVGFIVRNKNASRGDINFSTFLTHWHLHEMCVEVIMSVNTSTEGRYNVCWDELHHPSFGRVHLPSSPLYLVVNKAVEETT